MQTPITKIALTALITLSLAACNSKQELVDNAAADVETTSSIASDSVANRQFIRSVNTKFSVENVYQSTQQIEAVVHQNNGFLTLSDLQSHETRREQIEMSEDSLLEIKYFEVENSIQFRVPTVRLDTVLRQIGKQCNYLDYRSIKAEEVTFDWQTVKANTETLQKHDNRLRHAIDKKGQKLNEIANTEEILLDREIETNNAKTHGRQMADEINFSTVKITIYQPQTVAKSLIANTNQTAIQKSPFVFRANRALRAGWDFMQNILLFLVTGWAIWLILIGVWLVWRKVKTNTKLA
jgi:Domain of unknown function (DUF4349)